MDTVTYKRRIWFRCEICKGYAYDLNNGVGPVRIFLHTAEACNAYSDAGIRPHLAEVKGEVNEAIA